MDIKDIQSQAAERIWLFPGDHDGETTLLWCDDPAPSQGMEPAEAVEYVRKDVSDARIAELERERDMHKAAEEAQIALRQKADEREAALAANLERLREAADKIKHWHDASNDGMIVSAESVRDLWLVLAEDAP